MPNKVIKSQLKIESQTTPLSDPQMLGGSDPKMVPVGGSKTKTAGYLLFAIAVLNTAYDLLDGNGFNLSLHMNEIYAAVGGLGLVFLRKGLDKVLGFMKVLNLKLDELAQKQD